MNGWLIYWITRLDAVRNALCWGAALTTTLIATKYIISMVKFFNAADDKGYGCDGAEKRMEHEKERALNAPSLAKSILIIVMVWLCVSTIPSSKEAAAIYLIPKIANNEQVQKVPDNALRLLNAKLEEWIDDQIGTDEEPDDAP